METSNFQVKFIYILWLSVKLGKKPKEVSKTQGCYTRPRCARSENFVLNDAMSPIFLNFPLVGTLFTLFFPELFR